MPYNEFDGYVEDDEAAPEPYHPVKAPLPKLNRAGYRFTHEEQRRGGKNSGGAKAAAGMTPEARRERARKAAAARWSKNVS